MSEETTIANDGESAATLVKSRRALWLLLALLSTVVAATLLLFRALPEQPRGAPPPLLPFLLIAAGALLLFFYRVPPGEVVAAAPERPAGAAAIALRWRYLLFLGAWFFSALVLRQLPQMSAGDNYGRVTAAWVLSFLLYVLALVPPSQQPVARWRTRLATVRMRVVLGLVALLLLALALRLVALGSIPFTLGGDEASQGLEAMRVLEGEIRNPFSTGWLGVPTLSFFYNGLSLRLLGRTVTGLRLPWALLGAVTVPIAFLLLRRLWGGLLALAAAVLLATYHYHIHYSRLGSNQVADAFFVALALWFLYRALDQRRQSDWIITGAVGALALYFYAGARFTAVVIVAVLLFTFLRSPRRFWPRYGTGILAMLGAFLLVGAPIIQYALRFPDEFNARINQVAIIQSGWLERELAAGRFLLPVLWDQFRRAALAFNYYPDRTIWYGLRQPLLDPFFGVLFLLGLGYATLAMWRRGREERLAPLVIWWWGGILIGGMLTESPPSTQRLVSLTVPVCFFIVLALWRIIEVAHAALVDVPRRWLLAAGVLAFAVVSLDTYFLDFTPQRIYGGHHAELATELAPLLRELDDKYQTYFLGAPWMYWEFATIPYLAPQMEGEDILKPLSAPPSQALIQSGEGALFVILPERRDELPYVRQTFPAGDVRDVRATATDNRLLAILYLVPPPA